MILIQRDAEVVKPQFGLKMRRKEALTTKAWRRKEINFSKKDYKILFIGPMVKLCIVASFLKRRQG